MRDRLMVALDVPDVDAGLAMRDKLGDSVCWLKVGLRLFVAGGPALVHALRKSHKIFLDLKFHDIPNTVAEAVSSAGQLGVHMLNVHAGGGIDMMQAASRAAETFPGMRLIAVTVLTSDKMEAKAAGKIAVERALLARQAGLNGVVCSVHEVMAIKQACGADFLTVTPGIRLAGDGQDDQVRVATPGLAISSGADHLVVGRPILHAADPHAAAVEILRLMQQGV
ncbi:MAG: orotidine-5'-phosphate decarboxylase [Mariprofundaceae bacterium]